MGRITRLQNDVTHLQAKLADANKKNAALNRQWRDPKKVEERLKELDPSITNITRIVAEAKGE